MTSGEKKALRQRLSIYPITMGTGGMFSLALSTIEVDRSRRIDEDRISDVTMIDCTYCIDAPSLVPAGNGPGRVAYVEREGAQ
jgi:hypothetical protein